MDPIKLLGLPLRYRPWRRRHLGLILRDLAGGDEAERHHRMHLEGAIDWLCRAQDRRDGLPDAGGVSAGWSFEDGWLPSYPETSGYIVETLLAAARLLDRPGLVVRAQRIIEWELSLQQSDGAFPGHFGEPGSHPVIFNTGQIMHGMVAGYVQLGRKDCLESAVRAGHWLARHQDADGCWRKYEHNGVPHVYNTRASWALAVTAVLAGDSALRRAALANLQWAASQQTASGWFATNAFTPNRAPFTHTIAYAIRGFLESGLGLGEDRFVAVGVKAAQGLAAVQRADGWLAGTYADAWVPRSSYCCLTGVAQMSLNWIRLAQQGAAPGLRDNAWRAIAYLKRRQRLNDADDAVRGGIAGSFPIWGAYSRFEYPNWAPKFYADALMMDLEDTPVPPAVAPVAPGEAGADV